MYEEVGGFYQKSPAIDLGRRKCRVDPDAVCGF